jgi:hypothetical protein
MLDLVRSRSQQFLAERHYQEAIAAVSAIQEHGDRQR